jgi:hypothetical protein
MLATALQLPSTVLAQISAGMVEAKDCDGGGHGKGLEHPEEPLISEGVPMHTLSELGDAEDAADLLELSA